MTPSPPSTLARRLAAELLGTTILVAIVVGSGIMGARLAGGNTALALLAVSLGVAAGIVALVLALGGVSGAHFNPLVTLAGASQGWLAWRDVPGYLAAQCAGSFAGVAVAHAMFGLPLFALAHQAHGGSGQVLGEFVGTFGLFTVVFGCVRARPDAVPFAVAAYVLAACWFTSSSSCANPAITLARAVTDTFVGLRLADVPGFVAAQCAGAASATVLSRWLFPPPVEAA